MTALPSGPLRVLFFMRSPGYPRNYESTLRLLAERGHEIHLVFDHPDRLGSSRLVDRLNQDFPKVTFGWTPNRDAEKWLPLARLVRGWQDYLRYQDSRYEGAAKLRKRAESRVPAAFVAICRWPVFRTDRGRDLLQRILVRAEAAIPVDSAVRDWMRGLRPDVVLVTPLVDFGSIQVDYVKCARELGIPCILTVQSWDNLTNKGLVKVTPDLVTVWNDMQKREAIEFHGVPPERITVTGAPAYDHWFGWRASRTPSEFCRMVGLDAAQPFLLYLGSSPFIAPQETDFVAEWIRGLRSSPDPTLRNLGVLIRPHPQNYEQWDALETSQFRNVVVWPRGGANPIDAATRSDYFDSMYHSVGIVGVNTSGLIEAGVIGRPVYTVLSPEFADTQEGTLHFHHLLHVNGGLLHVARDLTQHYEQLAAGLASQSGSERSRKFVQAFVRPQGLDQPSTPLLVEAVEKQARTTLNGDRRPVWLVLLRWLLIPLAFLASRSPDARHRRLKAARRAAPERKAPSLSTAPGPSQTVARRLAGRILDGVVSLRPIRVAVKRHVVPRVMQRAAKAEPLTNGWRTGVSSGRTERSILEAAQSARPVISGPWTGSLAGELLYWIPFLHWAKGYGAIPSSRLITVSRKVTKPWYGGLASCRFDLDEIDAGKTSPPRSWGRLPESGQSARDLDREILRDLRRRTGTQNAVSLPASLVLDVAEPIWAGKGAANVLDDLLDDRGLPPAPPLPQGIPEGFVAVHFLFGPAFPDTTTNRMLAADVMRTLAAQHPIVCLETGENAAPIPVGADVLALDRIVPEEALPEAMTAVAAHGRAFVGSYGGFAHAAPFYGVSSVALYSDLAKVPAHELEQARRAFARPGRGTFQAIDASGLDVLRLLVNPPTPNAEAAGDAIPRPTAAITDAPLMRRKP